MTIDSAAATAIYARVGRWRGGGGRVGTCRLNVVNNSTAVCIKNKCNNIFLAFAVSKAKIIGNTEMYIRSGSDINLTCVVLETPDPPSFIYWYRDRDVINYSGRGGISVVTEKQTRTSRLLISKAQPPDTGNYTCAPSASDSASVTVHVLNGDYITIVTIILYTQDVHLYEMYCDRCECNRYRV